MENCGFKRYFYQKFGQILVIFLFLNILIHLLFSLKGPRSAKQNVKWYREHESKLYFGQKRCIYVQINQSLCFLSQPLNRFQGGKEGKKPTWAICSLLAFGKKKICVRIFFPCSEGIKGLLLFPPKDPSVACFGLARLLGPFGRHRLDFSESCHRHSMKESSMSWLKNLVPLEDIRDFCHHSSYLSFPWALKYSFFVQFF